MLDMLLGAAALVSLQNPQNPLNIPMPTPEELARCFPTWCHRRDAAEFDLPAPVAGDGRLREWVGRTQYQLDHPCPDRSGDNAGFGRDQRHDSAI